MSCCSSGACAIIGKIFLLLVTLTEVATAYGVYMTHFAAGGATFGSTTASLSLIAFAINTGVWLKLGKMQCKSCSCGPMPMPVGKK